MTAETAATSTLDRQLSLNTRQYPSIEEQIDNKSELVTRDDSVAAQREVQKPTLGDKSMLGKVSHLLPTALVKKTEICKHRHGCFENVVRKALKNFFIGFGLQLLLKNILFIAKPDKFLRNL